MTGLGLTKWLCLGLLGASLALAAWALAADAESAPWRWHRRYVARLDAGLEALFLPARGRWICVGQALLLEAVALIAVWRGSPVALAAAVAVLLAPQVWLEHQRRRRVRQLDRQVDPFLLTLANALRATPSLGQALAHAERLMPAPMSQELGRVLRELRVGNSIDAALRDLARRAACASLDAGVLALLIGRQIGGELTKVLETTAATLREMARLRGVLRAKTAEAKAQLWVLALFPAFLLFAFDRLEPGYFRPLLGAPIGWALIAVAALLWLGALLIARRVLAVRL